MLTDVTVYTVKRKLPDFILKFFFYDALITTSAPYFPRIGEKRETPKIPLCHECGGNIEVSH